MKNNIYLLIGCLWLCAIQNKVYAQAQLHTSITSVSDANPLIGDQILINILLKNESFTDTFNGIINFDLANTGGVINNGSIVGKPNYNGTSITLAPLETKTGLFTVQIQGPYFVVGPDIIIVWPIASATILDSARTNINIQAALGIEEDESDNLLLWQNGDELFLQLGNAEKILQGVRIYALNGQLRLTQQLAASTNRIPIKDLPAGVYVAEVRLMNGETYKLKWVRVGY
jgi:hypothetical protein